LEHIWYIYSYPDQKNFVTSIYQRQLLSGEFWKKKDGTGNFGNIFGKCNQRWAPVTARNHPHIFRLKLLFFQNADSAGIIISITAIITLLLIWRILFYDGESTRTVSLREHNSGNFFLYEIRTNIDRHRKTIWIPFLIFCS